MVDLIDELDLKDDQLKRVIQEPQEPSIRVMVRHCELDLGLYLV